MCRKNINLLEGKVYKINPNVTDKKVIPIMGKISGKVTYD